MVVSAINCVISPACVSISELIVWNFSVTVEPSSSAIILLDFQTGYPLASVVAPADSQLTLPVSTAPFSSIRVLIRPSVTAFSWSPFSSIRTAEFSPRRIKEKFPSASLPSWRRTPVSSENCIVAPVMVKVPSSDARPMWSVLISSAFRWLTVIFFAIKSSR